jgi:hypothetical protein
MRWLRWWRLRKRWLRLLQLRKRLPVLLKVEIDEICGQASTEAWPFLLTLWELAPAMLAARQPG